jgi:hypothetical protein
VTKKVVELAKSPNLTRFGDRCPYSLDAVKNMASNIVRAWNSKTIRQREDGYMSLTDMASANGKKFGHWIALKSTVGYLQELAGSIDRLIEANESDGSNEERGTWGHRRVAIRFAQWCSPRFAVQVDAWVEELLTNGSASIGNQDPRIMTAELLAQLAHAQVALEERQKELELENQRIRLEQQQIQAEQTIQAETIAQHDAEIGRIFQPDGALISLAGCLNLHGKHATAAQLAPVGKAAAKAYRERYGKEPERVGDARYGTVNVYPQAIAQQALVDHGYLAFSAE